MAHEDDITKAADLIKAGKQNQAGEILINIVQKDPDCEQAWLWLSICVNQPEKKRFCLKKVLALNPENEAAWKAWMELGPAAGPAPAPVVKNPPAPAAAAWGPVERIDLPVERLVEEPAAKPAAPVKRNPIAIGMAVFAGVLLLVIIGIAALMASRNGNNSNAATIQVEYKVYGTANAASITYNNTKSGSDPEIVGLPWTKKYAMAPFAVPYVVAVNQGGGSLTCEIQVNGKVWKTQTAQMDTGIVICGGILGPSGK